MNFDQPPPDDLSASQSEMLILPDGRLLVHNLTPELALLLSELDPGDECIKSRAQLYELPD